MRRIPAVPDRRRPRSAPPLRFPIDLPADRLAPRVGSMPGAALLEGGPGFGTAGRWSLLAARPRARFEATGRRFGSRHGKGRGPALLEPCDPLLELGRVIEEYGLRRPVEPFEGSEHAPPFLGGLIGFFGYDLAPLLERLPRRAPRDSRLPDLWFALYDTVVAIDHASGEAALWAADLLGEGPRAVESRARGWLGELEAPPSWLPRSSFETPPASNFAPVSYRDAIGRAIAYIHAGDVFQANIAQRFVSYGRPEPLDLYRRLRERSPAPYSAFLGLGDGLAVVGSSPELFFEARGDRIVTRPIKGTRPRGSTPEDDAARRAELGGSAKDRAELAMIVDLERNDLGRICSYGTVRVTEPGVIESFATVHHRVATIEGRLRIGVGPADVVRAVFPGGSITGAPKIRAMEIIDELEPTRRGLYTGAVGYYGLGGASAFNVAIRTMLVEGGRASYQVGGGIVADSDPLLEYEETLHKGRAMREVLEECS